MKDSIQKALKETLFTLDITGRAELKRLFEEEFHHPPTPRASRDYLHQNLAWAEQAKSINPNHRKQRQKLIKRLSQVLVHSKQRQLLYRPGTRLVREWQGNVYQVTVLEKGFEWDGRIYPNLTRIATEITGTKWSGPRFFGLTGGKNEDS